MLHLEHMDDEHPKRLRDIYERLGNQARAERKDRSWWAVFQAVQGLFAGQSCQCPSKTFDCLPEIPPRQRCAL